jgi:hypothetical protein
MYAREPEMAKRWEKETPKGKDLPEKVTKESALKVAFDSGVAAALRLYGVKTASSQELRLQIPRRAYHGLIEALKKANVTQHMNEPLEPQGAPDSPAEKLTEALQGLDGQPTAKPTNMTRDRLNREVSWGPASSLAAGQNIVGVDGAMGQDTGIGTAF